MISTIKWIPKGKINPNPLLYEISPTEKRMLLNNSIESKQEEKEKQSKEETNIESMLSEEEEEEAEETNQEEITEKQKNLNKLIESLPKDLRMDEYSSDEENDDDDDSSNEGTNHESLGKLLLGDIKDDVDVMDNPRLMDTAEAEEDIEDNDDDIDTDSDDDDDFGDIPDTREYQPVDIEGLQNMNLVDNPNNKNPNNNNIQEYFDNEDEEDDNSEYEDLKLQPDSDVLILVGKTKGNTQAGAGDDDDDFPSIEVNVYEASTGNLYPHHDISLPSFPLCMAYGDYDIQSLGTGFNNYCAVGMFTPGIEIWNLDVINPLEPTLILGGDAPLNNTLDTYPTATTTTSKKKKKKQQSSPQLHKGSHTDAVLSLCWNTHYRNVLCSGSADDTVKLWDLNSSTPSVPVTTFSHHTDKVSCVEWHPTDHTLLASASYDRTICLLDARTASTDSTGNTHKLLGKVGSDIESIAWDPFNAFLLTVLEEDGHLLCYDVRMLGNASNDSNSKKKNKKLLSNYDDTTYWNFVANDMGGVTDISYNSQVPGMLASSSINHTVTIYDVQSFTSNKTQPQKLPPSFNKDMNVGKLFTLNFYPSSPWLLGCGGSQNDIALWCLESDETIMNHFQSRCTTGTTTTKEEVKEDTFVFEKKMEPEDVETVDTTALLKKKKKDKKKSKRKVHKA